MASRVPRVSVIIPAYNAAAYLPHSIESVMRQTFADWEIVLVDDGSTDQTAAVWEDYQPKLQDQLKYVHQPNRGIAAARNTAMRSARGEFIALLDADDVWLPQRLERGVEILDGDPETGLVHARVARIDGNGAVIGQLKVEPKYLSGRIAHNIYTRRAHIICPTVIFRRNCLQTTGPFDETLRTTEDRDLWFRIARQSKVSYINEVLAYYRLSPLSITKDLNGLLKGQIQFVTKHYQSGACTRMEHLEALGNIYRELGDSLFREGNLTPAIHSYLRAVRYYPLSIPNTYMLFRAIMEPIVRVCAAN
jgi:glycosyltransferase involved in cell wall biosynthesis